MCTTLRVDLAPFLLVLSAAPCSGFRHGLQHAPAACLAEFTSTTMPCLQPGALQAHYTGTLPLRTPRKRGLHRTTHVQLLLLASVHRSNATALTTCSPTLLAGACMCKGGAQRRKRRKLSRRLMCLHACSTAAIHIPPCIHPSPARVARALACPAGLQARRALGGSACLGAWPEEGVQRRVLLAGAVGVDVDDLSRFDFLAEGGGRQASKHTCMMVRAPRTGGGCPDAHRGFAASFWRAGRQPQAVRYRAWRQAGCSQPGQLDLRRWHE